MSRTQCNPDVVPAAKSEFALPNTHHPPPKPPTNKHPNACYHTCSVMLEPLTAARSAALSALDKPLASALTCIGPCGNVQCAAA